MGLFSEGPKSRNTDPSTSHGAKKFRLNADRKAVWDAHYHNRFRDGLTDYELAGRMARQFNSVNVRRGELRDHGLVEAVLDSQGKEVKRLAPSGSWCIVWRITAKGIAQYELYERIGWPLEIDD